MDIFEIFKLKYCAGSINGKLPPKGRRFQSSTSPFFSMLVHKYAHLQYGHSTRTYVLRYTGSLTLYLLAAVCNYTVLLYTLCTHPTRSTGCFEIIQNTLVHLYQFGNNYVIGKLKFLQVHTSLAIEKFKIFTLNLSETDPNLYVDTIPYMYSSRRASPILQACKNSYGMMNNDSSNSIDGFIRRGHEVDYRTLRTASTTNLSCLRAFSWTRIDMKSQLYVDQEVILLRKP